MGFRRLFWLPLGLAFLLGSCAGGPKTREAPLVPPHLSGAVTNEPLVYALRALERVKDDGLKLSLLDRTAEVCLQTGLRNEGLAVLSYASQLFQRKNSQYQFEELGIAFAKRYLEFGLPQSADRLLLQGLEHADALGEEVRKRFVFEEIIGTGLAGGEPFLLLLKRAVDSVLVLDDAALKTDLLMESAMRFYEAGRLKDSRDLIQLTLSQVGSLDDPVSKAEIYSRLALLYKKFKEEPRVEEYARKTLNSLKVERRSPLTEQEAGKVAAVAANLFRASYVDEAVKVLESLPQLWIYAEALERLGLEAFSVGEENQFEEYVDRAFESAAAIADNAKRLSTLFLLDSLLVEQGQAVDTWTHFPLREAELFAFANLPEWDDLAFRLARLYLLTGDLEAAERILNQIREPYNKAAALVSAARELAVRKGKTGEAPVLLQEARALMPRVDRSKDRLFREMASVYLLIEEPRLALEAAAAIVDPYPLAIAVSDIAKYFLAPNRGLDEDSRLRLKRLAGS